MKTTNNKQTTEELQEFAPALIRQRLEAQLEAIEVRIANTFSRYKRNGSTFRIAIEEEGKVNKIEGLKDYLNNTVKDYQLAVKFSGGSDWLNYTTILSVDIIE